MATTQSTVLSSTQYSLTAEEALGMEYTDGFVIEQVVDATVPVAFEKFREVVWLKNAGVGPESWTKIAIPSENEQTHDGETRVAAGVVSEKLLRVTPNEEYLYAVVAGPFPVKNHLGSVKFFKEGENKTKIVWALKYTPRTGFGMIIKSTMSVFLKLFLRNLENTLKAEAALPEMANELEISEAESKIYTDNTCVEKVISGPTPLVFQKFREVVWLRNGGVGPASWTTVLEQGDEQSHAGEVRSAAGLVQEKIIRVVENENITYTVLKGFPVYNHLGKVTFEPVENNKTKVSWAVYYTPLPGAGLVVKGLVQGMFPVFLYKLESEVTAASPPTS